MGILVVDALQDGSKGTARERERNYTWDHDQDAHDLFAPGVDVDVTVAHGRNGRNCEVKWGQILLICADFEVAVTHPCFLGVLVEMGQHHPYAGDYVHQDEEGEEEGD